MTHDDGPRSSSSSSAAASHPRSKLVQSQPAPSFGERAREKRWVVLFSPTSSFSPRPRDASTLHDVRYSSLIAFFNCNSGRGLVQSRLLIRAAVVGPTRLPVCASRSFRSNCSASAPATDGSENSATKKRVVSGIQPTGSVHLGNYLGAIKNWISLQITLPYDAKEPSKATRSAAALYLACGIDTSKSHVRAHVELMWLLSSTAPVGQLTKTIQFKEKSCKGDENIGVALLSYPVLISSDILLYQSDLVSVGEDKKQHLELTHELAEKCGALFKVPEALIPPAGARVMSLTDGLSKMSKSSPSDQSRINLLDPKDGDRKAADITHTTLDNVYHAMGFLRRQRR